MPEHEKSTLRICVWIFLACSILFAGLTRGHFISTDEINVYQAARSLWEKGDLSVTTTTGVPGRDGKIHSYFSSGQSVAALPLYGLGKAIRLALESMGRQDWAPVFAGHPEDRKETGDRWGGDVEIFFVNLFNSFVTALLCAVFFAFSSRLGVSTGWSLVATALFTLSSYIIPFSAGFFQHSSEALLVLWSFYLLFRDKQHPSWKARFAAGAVAAVLIQFRFASVFALPGLAFYHLWVVRERRPPALPLSLYLSSALRQMLPFFGIVALGLLVHCADQYVKFGTFHLTGDYGKLGFNTPLYVGLFGLLLSPGDSIFIFTPLLVLLPWTLSLFGRRHPAEAYYLIFQSLFYILTYAAFDTWEGLWCFGPRYLSHLCPLLLLPLGPWMEHTGRRAWFPVAPLAIAGLWMQAIHFAVNFWYVDLYVKYPDFQPPHAFLFIPQFSPVIAHGRALLAGDGRVDMWLVNVYRDFGAGRFLIIAVPLLLIFVFCIYRIIRNFCSAEASATATVACGSSTDSSAPCRPASEGPAATRRPAFGLPVVLTVLCLACWGFFLKAVYSRPSNATERNPFQVTSTAVEEKRARTPEDFLSESYIHYQAGRYLESIRAANEALKLNPAYDNAYNNICASYNQLGLWDEAIAACNRAISINPDNQLARNNLAWALERKTGAGKGSGERRLDGVE
jgi:hypothetical protein